MEPDALKVALVLYILFWMAVGASIAAVLMWVF